MAALTQCLARLGLASAEEEEQKPRLVGFNAESSPEVRAKTNFVRISKYSSYVALILWFTIAEFFTQAANVYFLGISILQSITEISTTNGVPTTLFPLTIVFLASAIREFAEEYSRKQEEATENVKRKAVVFRGGEAPKEVSWQEIKVGDVVKCENESFLPCDMVLLGVVHNEREGDSLSESARRAKIASCHVDTASLDGESNLKKFTAISSEVAEAVQSEENISRLQLQVKVGPSMAELGKFEGRVEQGSFGENEFRAPDGSALEIRASTKGNAHVLLRECKIRNCAHVYGLAVFTGEETFIKQQSKKVGMKAVFIGDAINYFVRIMLALQIVLCVIGAVNYAWFVSTNQESMWYLDLGNVNAGQDAVLRFFTFVQVTSGLIPISLYVSMEMARVAQKFLMERDDDMYHCTPNADTKNIRLRVRNLQLNDQLGQITHIFSDKTGTLTENSFEFRKFSVGGYVYGSGTTEIAVISARGQARSEADRAAVKRKEAVLKRGQANMRRPGKYPHVNFVEEEGCRRPLAHVLSGAVRTPDPINPGADMTEEHVGEILDLLLSFVVCSTVDIEPEEQGAGDGSADGGESGKGVVKCPKFCGDSSDEVTFTYAAYQMGVRMVRRTFTEDGQPAVDIEMRDPRTGGTRVVRRVIAALNEFNSARGMMSIAVEDPSLPEDHPKRVTIYAKGSDKRIMAHLFPVAQGRALDALPEADRMHHRRQAWMRERTKTHAGDFSTDGFRTLAFAKKHISRRELVAWRPRVREARARAKAAYEEHLEKFPGDESGAKRRRTGIVSAVLGELEKDMSLQAVVGYEDSLQQGVPNAIARLSDAGITVFMLTGDKRNTALNIGFGTQMLTNETDVLDLTWEEREAAVFGRGDEAKLPSQPLLAERQYLQELFEAFDAGNIVVDADADPEDFNSSTPGSSVSTSPTPSGSTGTGAGAGAGSGAVIPIAEDDGGDSPASADVSAENPLSGAGVSDAGGGRGVGGRGGSDGHTSMVSPLAGPSVSPETHATSPKEGSDLEREELLISLENVHYPRILETVAVLSPPRDPDTDTIDSDARHTALALLHSLQVEVRRVEKEAIELRSVTDKGELARRRADVIRFVLALDLAILTVKYGGGSSRPLALVLDDKSMEYYADWPGYEEILADKQAYPQGVDSPHLRPKINRRLALLRLTEKCAAVIGSRCQPSQKRTILELYKFEVPGSCCLAIGDGANDVEMISAAHVGVGIEGLEGNAAANAADYSLGQFRFLEKLLLVHGAWNYRRMCLLCLFMFYKNLLFTLCQFLYGSSSGWSGQKIYPEVATQSYNLMFTGAAVVAVAALEQPTDAVSNRLFPFLYSFGRLREGFNPWIAVWWLLQALYESFLILYVVRSGYDVGATAMSSEGPTVSVFEFGTVVLTIVIGVVNMRLAIEVYQHEYVFIAFTLLSTATWPIIAFILDATDAEDLEGVMHHVWASPQFWFLIPLAILMTLGPSIVFKSLRVIFLPDYATIVRESELFLRGGQYGSEYYPMVESEETVAMRKAGKPVNDMNRQLVRASTPWERANACTQWFVQHGREPLGLLPCMVRRRTGVTIPCLHSLSCCRPRAAGDVMDEDDPFRGRRVSVFSLPRRRSRKPTPVEPPAAPGTAGAIKAAASEAAASAVSRQSGRATAGEEELLAPPSLQRALRARRGEREIKWAEQEARLMLWPIEKRLEVQLENEERSRLAYPYHFYKGLMVRKRIHNLVQQGRLDPKSVGLRPFPDEDIVLGAAEEGKKSDKGDTESEDGRSGRGSPTPSSSSSSASTSSPSDDRRRRLLKARSAAHMLGRHRSVKKRVRERFNPSHFNTDFTTDEDWSSRYADVVLDSTDPSKAGRRSVTAPGSALSSTVPPRGVVSAMELRTSSSGAKGEGSGE